ncbi:unnamed protein product [Urochloa humidicola]
MEALELLEAKEELAALHSKIVAAGLFLGPHRQPPPRNVESAWSRLSDSGSEILSPPPPSLAGGRVPSSRSGKGDGQDSGAGAVGVVAYATLQGLQDVYYKMILPVFGFGTRKKTRPNVTRRFTAACSSGFASAVEVHSLFITHRSDGMLHRSGESLVAVLQKCRLLTRGMQGIAGSASADGTEEEEGVLSVFASDDLTCSRQGKVTRRITRQTTVPTQMAEPIYSLPKAIRNLLVLDLSGCSGLSRLPASIVTLQHLFALNLSYCHSLRTLPASLGTLQNLHILLLSCCHKLENLPASLCELYTLRLLDLSGCSSIEVLPDYFVSLICLEILNLSDCIRLKNLPQPIGSLQELKYLNLSSCHGLDLDVEYLRRLAKLKCLTLSPVTEFRSFPDSLHHIGNYLERSRWWKRTQIHPQCNPKVTSFHSYRCHEQSIIDMLLSDGSDECGITSDQIITSICIVGESGMGKTELVHQIYNNQMILDAFNLRIWVCMCDKKRLLEKIAEYTNCAYCSNAPISVVEEIVMEELAGKRLLLVLDDSDIESHYFWSDLRKLLSVCANGSALIVTTTSNEVAFLVGAMKTFYLSSLSKEECFMIFKRHVFAGLDMNNCPQLEGIGWKTVDKCGGNPLCIKALSGLLCHSEIGLAEIDMLVGGTLPALQLCYDLLPSHLQHCFRFCSLFPKGYIFVKHQIVRLWISQGFVFPEEGNQPEDTGLHYFDELFCRSFFQRSPFHNDQDHKFVIHELFHDLAASVSKNEYMRCEEPFCCMPENTYQLSLVFSDFNTVALTKVATNLRSFLVVRGSFPVVRILHLKDFYAKIGFLRALNLTYTDIIELPSSIGNMKHLRLLALNNTKIKSLPSEIGKVDTLQTLDLKDCCHLIDLPESTSSLVKLRHLDVQKEPGNIKVGMPHGIGQLTDLQTLTEFNIGKNLSQCSIAELKNLNGLRGHVHITGLENIKTADDAREATIVDKHFLEALTLEWSYTDEGMDDGIGPVISNKILQNLQPSSNLQKLVVRNYAGNLFPLWMQDSYLSKLVSITLDNCYNCSELPYLGDLPSLKSLFIQRMNSIETFGIMDNSLATEEKRPPRFPSLEELTLWEMYDLQFWAGTSEGDFPQIRRLSISRCPKLKSLPPLLSLVHLTIHSGGVPSFSELPSLKSLKIEGFHKIRSITFPHQLKMLKKLDISDCKELSSLFAYSLSVSDLKIMRCPKLDLIGSSLEDHLRQKVVGGRNMPTRSSVVPKTEADANVHHDGWQWLKHGEMDIFGTKFPRSYYRCIRRNSTGCIAMKILQPKDTDPNALSVMYISEHNHEFPNETYLELSSEHGTTRKRKESDLSGDENLTKRHVNEFFK